MDITKFAILKKLAGGGGGGSGHEDEIIARTITNYTNNSATSIGEYAFYYSKLESVNFSKVTSIGESAFEGCRSLTSADFPAATSIGDYAFFQCTSLTSLILRATTQVCTLSGTDAFINTHIASGTGYIYVPAALIDSYKTATNWTTYANQFRALESYTVDGTTTGELDPTKVNA